MKIRSITYFLNPGWPLQEETVRAAGKFLTLARPAFEEAGYEVQSARLATVPFPRLISTRETIGLLEFARDLESVASKYGYQYISLGPALPDVPESYQVIPAVLESTQNVFMSGIMSTQATGISIPAIRLCARVIHQAARHSPDGFTNLRFAALANVLPGSPFFPAAYHGEDSPAFALATEAADLAVDAFTNASSIHDGRERLVTSLETHAQKLEEVAGRISKGRQEKFLGIDFTLAPFPVDALSVGAALERLGAPAAGKPGSLAASAILADAIDRAQFKRTGFCGLMLPVLEDSILAKRAAQGSLTVRELLLYSAVCGTGLDTIPLPGDTTPDQLAAILLDLAALAQRLEKPLTARLMPIPGKSAGDPTNFEFAYFANSRIMALDASPLQGLFSTEDRPFSLLRRKPL
ncbi:MAG: DUF711 family protein [Chloroflexota bacterium]|nr:MAG: DUF711 family protein [Chloroflexota bacterium]